MKLSTWERLFLDGDTGSLKVKGSSPDDGAIINGATGQPEPIWYGLIVRALYPSPPPSDFDALRLLGGTSVYRVADKYGGGDVVVHAMVGRELLNPIPYTYVMVARSDDGRSFYVRYVSESTTDPLLGVHEQGGWERTYTDPATDTRWVGTSLAFRDAFARIFGTSRIDDEYTIVAPIGTGANLSTIAVLSLVGRTPFPHIPTLDATYTDAWRQNITLSSGTSGTGGETTLTGAVSNLLGTAASRVVDLVKPVLPWAITAAVIYWAVRGGFRVEVEKEGASNDSPG